MLRRKRSRAVLVCSLIGLVGCTVAAAAVLAANDVPACAKSADGGVPASPGLATPCWVAEPYPFGREGGPADTGDTSCQTSAAAGSCPLEVT